MNNYFNTNLRPTLTHIPKPIEYKVFYNKDTLICTYKTVDQIDASDNYTIVDSYIIVDSETYNLIDFCSNYQVVNGELEKIIITTQKNKKISQQETGNFLTTKNNMIFIVDELYLGEIDRWGCI